jgi:hypothetical protein
VPSGSAHGDEAVTDVGPQRKARAAAQGFEFLPHIEAAPLILQRVGSVCPGHRRFGNAGHGRSHCCELHCGSSGAQVS